MRIGCHDHAAGRYRETSLIITLTQPFIIKGSQKQFFNQLCRSTTTGSVSHINAAIFNIQRTYIGFFNNATHTATTVMSLKRP